MAGSLTIDTLVDGSGNSTSATNCIQGSAKAWVVYNGSAGTVLSSYNVTSVTYNSAGNYTINFTNAFADTNYCANLSSGVSTGSAGWPVCYVSTRATTSLIVRMGDYSGPTSANTTYTAVSIFR